MEGKLVENLSIPKFFIKHFCADDNTVRGFIEKKYYGMGDGFVLLKYDEQEEYATQDYSSEYKHYKIDCFCAVIYSIEKSEDTLEKMSDNYMNCIYHIHKLIFVDYYHNWVRGRDPVALINVLDVDMGRRIDYFLNSLFEIKVIKAIKIRDAFDSLKKEDYVVMLSIIRKLIVSDLNPDKGKKDDKDYYEDILDVMTKTLKGK